MKYIISSIVLVFILHTTANAQSQILDALTTFQSGTGISSVYLSDTNNIRSICIQIGNSPGNFTFKDSVAVYPGAPNVTIQNGEVDVNLGSTSYSSPYYIRYTVYLRDNTSHVIDLNK